MDILEFYKIKKEKIFTNDFEAFIKNNKIAFSNVGISVIYAPNGVGKTSLSKVLNYEEGSNFDAKFGSVVANENKNELFHVISDQNSRHIIQGETEEFLLGDDVRKEFELKKEIDNVIIEIFESKLPKILKDTFNISKAKSTVINLLEDNELKNISRTLQTINQGEKELALKNLHKKLNF